MEKVCKAFIYKEFLVLESHKMVTKRSQKNRQKADKNQTEKTSQIRYKNVTE